LRDISAAVCLLIPPADTDSPEFRKNERASALYDAQLWCHSSFFEHFSIDDFSDLPPAAQEQLAATVSRFIRVVSSSDRTQARTHLLSIFHLLHPTLRVFWANQKRD